MELIELLASEQEMLTTEFVKAYVDGEAYTSCDDEGDGLHECDFFGQYLGPTKWLHLTPIAHESIDQVHFTIWQDTWKNPHASVDVADRVSREVLSYYNKYLQPKHSTSTEPKIRIKVIPASFGLEVFEDVVWEAVQEILPSYPLSHNNVSANAITIVVASPDLSDPILNERKGCKTASPQAEFACDSFQSFAGVLQGKLEMLSKVDDVLTKDDLAIKAFHPIWREKSPYPCVAIGTGITRLQLGI
jgi:hypothetical protein